MSRRIRWFLISVSCLVVCYLVVGGVLGKGDSSTANEQTYRDLGVYSEVLSRVNSDYVTEPNLQRVTDGAIRGLLEALDPYCTYFTPREFQEYQQHPDPGPASIGIFLSKKYGYAPVISVLPASPAEKAGIKAGDLIDRVEDSAARELSVVQIERLLAGAPGSTVTLWVVREARGEPQKITLAREIIADVPVVAKMLEDGTAYIRVAMFDRGAAARISAKLKELTSQGANKVVLDLRSCAGGQVQEAVDVASLFLAQGLMIAYTQGQRSPRQNLIAKPEGPVCNLPLAVLINRSTAGPAELVADAVLGNQRGDVVGVPSYGVGVVEKLVPVGDGSGLLLSVAKYYGPDGKAIQDGGVTPNVVVSTGDETAAENETEPEHFGGKDDLQLQKAIEILKQKYAPAKAA